MTSLTHSSSLFAHLPSSSIASASSSSFSSSSSSSCWHRSSVFLSLLLLSILSLFLSSSCLVIAQTTETTNTTSSSTQTATITSTPGNNASDPFAGRIPPSLGFYETTYTPVIVPPTNITMGTLVDLSSYDAYMYYLNTRMTQQRFIQPDPNAPPLDGYFLGPGNPGPVDVSNLQYTNRDFERWDSYELSLTNVPSLRAINTKTTQGPTTLYHTLFQKELMGEQYTYAYQCYRGFAKSAFDIRTELKKNNLFIVDNAMSNVSLQINEAYNIYRNQWKAGHPGGNFDDVEIDWLSLPNVKSSIDWLESYLNDFFAIQSLTHEMIPRPTSSWPPFDSFGLFRQSISYGEGYNQFGHFFTAPQFGQILTHYAHLYSNEFLRKARIHCMASLTGSYGISALLSFDEADQLSAAQWYLRIVSWVTQTDFLLNSEKTLKRRGVWNEATDAIRVSDIPNGKWTNADALRYTEEATANAARRAKSWGIREYGGSYLGIQLDMMSMCLMHAPSQKVYDDCDAIWRVSWWDLVANYVPGAGAMSGTSARQADLINAAHNTIDRYDMRQYLQLLTPEMCNSNAPAQLRSQCPESPVASLPPSGGFGQGVSRFFYSMWQAAGIGYVPEDALSDSNFRAPYRTVEQKFAARVGQERMNFITPIYAIGHAGEDFYLTTGSILVSARLAGRPNPGVPKQVANFDTVTNAVNLIRLMYENLDNPFASIEGGPPAREIQLPARQIISQYQSFMLITSLAGPTGSWSHADWTKYPLNTNLMVPLAVDGIYVGNEKLPTTLGTVVAIPSDSVITIHHINASVVVKLVYAEQSGGAGLNNAAPITDVNRVTPLSSSDYILGSGLEKHTVTWIVDESSYASGGGRFTVHHKHAGDPSHIAFHLAWLWGAGITRNDAERNALARVLDTAVVNNQIDNDHFGPWTEHDPNNLAPVGSSTWNIDVQIGTHNLAVKRKDVYQPWKQARPFDANGLFDAPIYSENVQRLVDGRPILQFAANEAPFRAKSHAFMYTTGSPPDVFQPHLNIGILGAEMSNNRKPQVPRETNVFQTFEDLGTTPTIPIVPIPTTPTPTAPTNPTPQSSSTAAPPQHSWFASAFGACTANSAGVCLRSRTVTCNIGTTVVADSQCATVGTKPVSTSVCLCTTPTPTSSTASPTSTSPTAPVQWMITRWSGCERELNTFNSCAHTRNIHCQQKNSPNVFPDSVCIASVGPKENTRASCTCPSAAGLDELSSSDNPTSQAGLLQLVEAIWRVLTRLNPAATSALTGTADANPSIVTNVTTSSDHSP